MYGWALASWWPSSSSSQTSKHSKGFPHHLYQVSYSSLIGQFLHILISDWSVIVMMLGELEWKDLYFPTNPMMRMHNETAWEIHEEDEHQQFPGTAVVFIIMFILGFCLVISNLLVGLAVSDIKELLKTAKRDQLIAQIEMIASVFRFLKSNFIYKIMPQKIKRVVDRLVCRRLCICMNNFIMFLAGWCISVMMMAGRLSMFSMTIILTRDILERWSNFSSNTVRSLRLWSWQNCWLRTEEWG